MLALRSFQGPDALAERDLTRAAKPDASDWLWMQQAACELGVSISTVRRMIRKGRLRNRIVPRRGGGFAYLIYMPGSQHAHIGHSGEARRRLALVARADSTADGASPPPAEAASDPRVAVLEKQVERLSDALARALRLKQRDLPLGIGDPTERMTDPYARYRWLVRRHWWWPFS